MNSRIRQHGRGVQWSKPPAFPSGASGLVSTADDYLAFAKMLMKKPTIGKNRLAGSTPRGGNDLDKRLIAIILTERIPESAAPPGVIKDFWKGTYAADGN